MNLKNLKIGDAIAFDIGKKIDCKYVGRFDFAYLFDTKYKMLPITCVYNQSTLIIINLDLLKEYNFSKDEVISVLTHEIGHQISRKKVEFNKIELEYDADNYSISKCGKDSLLSALNKTKKLIEKETNNKDSIKNIEKRINNICKEFDDKDDRLI